MSNPSFSHRSSSRISSAHAHLHPYQRSPPRSPAPPLSPTPAASAPPSTAAPTTPPTKDPVLLVLENGFCLLSSNSAGPRKDELSACIWRKDSKAAKEKAAANEPANSSNSRRRFAELPRAAFSNLPASDDESSDGSSIFPWKKTQMKPAPVPFQFHHEDLKDEASLMKETSVPFQFHRETEKEEGGTSMLKEMSPWHHQQESHFKESSGFEHLQNRHEEGHAESLFQISSRSPFQPVSVNCPPSPKAWKPSPSNSFMSRNTIPTSQNHPPAVDSSDNESCVVDDDVSITSSDFFFNRSTVLPATGFHQRSNDLPHRHNVVDVPYVEKRRPHNSHHRSISAHCADPQSGPCSSDVVSSCSMCSSEVTTDDQVFPPVNDHVTSSHTGKFNPLPWQRTKSSVSTPHYDPPSRVHHSSKSSRVLRTSSSNLKQNQYHQNTKQQQSYSTTKSSSMKHVHQDKENDDPMQNYYKQCMFKGTPNEMSTPTSQFYPDKSNYSTGRPLSARATTQCCNYGMPMNASDRIDMGDGHQHHHQHHHYQNQNSHSQYSQGYPSGFPKKQRNTVSNSSPCCPLSEHFARSASICDHRHVKSSSNDMSYRYAHHH